MAQQRVHTDLDLQGNNLLNVGNWPIGGGGANLVELSFTYTAASPSYNLPEGTVGVPVLYNSRGRMLLPSDRTLALSASPPTMTVLASGAREGDQLYFVATVGSTDPDPDPPTGGTPAAPGAATESGTTSRVLVATGYSSPAAYEAEPVASSAPPTSTAPAAPAMATSSGTTSSVPLVASYSTPDQYEAETV